MDDIETIVRGLQHIGFEERTTQQPELRELKKQKHEDRPSLASGKNIKNNEEVTYDEHHHVIKRRRLN